MEGHGYVHSKDVIDSLLDRARPSECLFDMRLHYSSVVFTCSHIRTEHAEFRQTADFT